MSVAQATAPVLHVFKYPPGQGGMDYVQQLHVERGDACMALLHRNNGDVAPSASAPIELGGHSWSLLRSLRRPAARVFLQMQPQISVYYNCWGADALASVDTARVRLGYLHSSFPQFDDYVRHYSRWLDGFICVSPALAARVRRCAEGVAATCVASVPCPLRPAVIAMAVSDQQAAVSQSASGCVIGYGGRLVREQKRVDRLPALIHELDTALAGKRWSFEILGDGPERTRLEQALVREVADGKVRFLGWRDSDGVAAALKNWRYCVSVSDYEGLSLSMLEAAATGCMPIYPDFSGQDAGKAEVAGAGSADSTVRDFPEACLYRIGDMREAALRIRNMESQGATSSEMIELSKNLRTEMALRSEKNYLTAFDVAVTMASLRSGEGRELTAQDGGALSRGFVWSYNKAYKKLTGRLSFVS